MAIYLFGDTHGEHESSKLKAPCFPQQPFLTELDTVIVCGDFMFPFYSSDADPASDDAQDAEVRRRRASYRLWMDWFSAQQCTFAFLDGNHDNHPYWASLPTELWNEGLVSRSPDAANLLHLKRGEVYRIEGKRFWCFGGAESTDKALRTEGLNWWPQETADPAQMQHGRESLARHGYEVDYILTHTMPQCLLPVFGFGLGCLDPTAAYFDEIYRGTQFKMWFCGHFHKDVYKPFYRLRVLYQDYAIPE